jgi:hypothetical protein
MATEPAQCDAVEAWPSMALECAQEHAQRWWCVLGSLLGTVDGGSPAAIGGRWKGAGSPAVGSGGGGWCDGRRWLRIESTHAGEVRSAPTHQKGENLDRRGGSTRGWLRRRRSEGDGLLQSTRCGIGSSVSFVGF